MMTPISPRFIPLEKSIIPPTPFFLSPPNESSHLLTCTSQYIRTDMTQRQLERALTLSQFINRFKMCQVGRIDIANFGDEGSNFGAGAFGRPLWEEGANDGSFKDVFDEFAFIPLISPAHDAKNAVVASSPLPSPSFDIFFRRLSSICS
eukprot:CCRYP_007251-RB/>CCRYP_007251-RB protein AED:0.36 eAED:0.36 QI:2091/1/1/1/0/0/2/500/148